MNQKLVDSLAQIIQTLTAAERQELETKLSTLNQNTDSAVSHGGTKSTNRSSRFQQWDQISDTDAAALKAEFAQEDIIFAETILPEYSSNLQQQDYV
jgi:N-acetylmuramic acid 6-phosphate (MurNAc-6-P) etherase